MVDIVVCGTVLIVEAGAAGVGVVVAAAVVSLDACSVFVSLLPQENENRIIAINQGWKELGRFINVVFLDVNGGGREVIRGYGEL